MKLTVENYGPFFVKAEEFIAKPQMRKGQAYMNALFEVDAELYRQITATDIDPFYDDSKIPQFLAQILA